MDSIVYKTLRMYKSFIAGNDLDNVYMEYELSATDEKKHDIYIVLGIKEIYADKPFYSSGKRIFPANTTYSMTLLCNTDFNYYDIYSYFETLMIERLFASVKITKIQTKPIEYNQKLNKFQLYCEFTDEACFKL